MDDFDTEVMVHIVEFSESSLALEVRNLAVTRGLSNRFRYALSLVYGKTPIRYQCRELCENQNPP